MGAARQIAQGRIKIIMEQKILVEIAQAIMPLSPLSPDTET